jgi:hypothetical protein
MRIPYRNITLVITGIIATLLQCSPTQTVSGGTGSETVIGKLVNKDGSSAANATVMLIPSDYDPLSGKLLPGFLFDTTDAQGSYTLLAPDTGTYNIQAVHNTDRTRLLIQNIHVVQDTFVRPLDTLLQPGSIAVVPNAGFNGEIGYFYIPGTTISSSRRDTFGNILLDSVPEGASLSVCYAERNSTLPPVIIQDSITVVPGKTTVTGYTAWQYSQKITLNTTVSGANITGDVYDFPVLVRLTDANFDFQQTRSDGSDIRFAKDDNTPLRYEIERWDAVSKLAEVWVRLDTVYGNSNTQSFGMYWGNAAASSVSNSVAVFDTAIGFQGVWHFNHSYNDATARTKNGTNNGTSLVEAAIGAGCSFTDTTQYVALPAMWTTAPTAVTLSCWINTNSVSPNHRFLIYLGQSGEIALSQLSDSLSIGTKTKDSSWIRIRSDHGLTAGSWYHVCGTWKNADSLRIYINGTLQGAIAASSDGLFNPGTQWQSSIGAYNRGAQYLSYSGLMDESRVETTDRKADWIRLSYMNQRPDGDRLLRF